MDGRCGAGSRGARDRTSGRGPTPPYTKKTADCYTLAGISNRRGERPVHPAGAGSSVDRQRVWRKHRRPVPDSGSALPGDSLLLGAIARLSRRRASTGDRPIRSGAHQATRLSPTSMSLRVGDRLLRRGTRACLSPGSRGRPGTGSFEKVASGSLSPWRASTRDRPTRDAVRRPACPRTPRCSASGTGSLGVQP